MRSPKILLLLLLTGPAYADYQGFLLGGGLETDSDDGLRAGLLGSVGFSEDTWLSGAVSGSSVELASGRNSDTIYADIELDHHFNPVGITLGAAYWGDPDILDSVDLRGSLYFRNDKFMLAGEVEKRDFDFIIPSSDVFPGREFAFEGDGIGARARVHLSDAVSLSVSGMKYDYSVDFVPDENRDAISLISVSRLSLINNLIDSRASLDVGIDVGLKRWEIDFSTTKGALDRSRSRSVTVRYLTPLSRKTDIEFGLGYDDADLYGNVTFFSVYLYFYGR
ncbi:MAG: hypothetical protein ACR2QT_14880 [Woeseiaceae bacterium]